MADLKFATREEIVTSLEAAMLAIPNIKKVDRQHYENFSNYEYPSGFLNEVREERRMWCRDVVEVNATYSIVLFDHSKDEDLSTKLNSLIDYGVSKIMESPYRGDKAYSTEIISIDTDAGFLYPHCVAILTVKVMYLARA